jgi:hypothetical protein
MWCTQNITAAASQQQLKLAKDDVNVDVAGLQLG